MRRKDKILLSGAAIVGGGFFLYDLWKQSYDKSKQNEKLTWDNYNAIQGLKQTISGAALGIGSGYLFYKYKLIQEAKIPFNSDLYLDKVLAAENLKSDPYLYQAMLAKRQEIKTWLSVEFDTLLVSMPEDAGSFANRTAIVSNYDLDIVVPFKRSSYNSLEEMYNDVYSAINTKFGNTANVIKQTKAISIEFETNKLRVYIDIVPGREINNYKIDRELNLFVTRRNFWNSNSSFKTKVRNQMLINNTRARKIVKLLKIYKERNILDLPSVIIDHCVSIRPNMSDYKYSTKENLLDSMRNLANKLGQNKLRDNANTNNNLNNKVDSFNKSHIISLLYSDIDKIEKEPRYLKEIFPNT